MKKAERSELSDTEWLLKFDYFVVISEHLNLLNVKMQSIGYTGQAVFAFENKLSVSCTSKGRHA